MEALLSAFGIVFLAELGDKSMLFSLTAATRYRWWMVLIPVAVASALLMGLAVLVGGVAGELLPDQVVAVVAALLFIGFGIWILLAGDEDARDEDVTTSNHSRMRVMVALGSFFFLAEFGDKTQVATLSLAGLQSDAAVFVWVGATVAMVAVNGLAILAGTRITRYVGRSLIRFAAGALFIGFGLAALIFTFW